MVIKLRIVRFLIYSVVELKEYYEFYGMEFVMVK